MVSTVFVARISSGDASKVSRTTPVPRSATRGWCKVECRLPLARRTCASRKGKSPPRRAPPRTRISLRASNRQRWSESRSRSNNAPSRRRAPGTAAEPGAGGSAQSEIRQGAPAQQQPAQAGGWRRFGDRPAQDVAPPVNRNAPAQSNTRSLQSPAPRTNETPAQQNRSGWQRFGAPGTETQTAPPRSPETQSAPQSGWNRFGSPGATPNEPRQQAQPPVYRSNPAPSYRAPQYSPAPAPRPSAPQSSPPAASRPSSGGGGSVRSGGSSSGSRGGHGR